MGKDKIDFRVGNSQSKDGLKSKSSKSKRPSMLLLWQFFGQYRPRFLPEGCKPGSHQLQKTVADVFRDLPEDKTILAFDNLLLLAETMEEAEETT